MTALETNTPFRELRRLATHVASDIAGPAAPAVDADARFPSEAVGALRDTGLLGAAVPWQLGGGGAGLAEVCDLITVLGRACASTAMIYAMHQIQTWCLIRHGRTDALRDLLAAVATERLLLASATTEASVGGDVRSSICALELAGDRFYLEKQAPVISYGAEADAVLATARRTPDSPPSDQVIVACPRPGLTLEPTGGWDTIGFRGTCSQGFVLRAEGPAGLVFPAPYADISAQTMLPVSHIVWSSVWLGLAESAAAKAHRYVRAAGRKQPGSVPPAANRLAELAAVLGQLRGVRRDALEAWAGHDGDPEGLGSMQVAVAMNGLKLSASTLAADVVCRALAICGMAGYRNDSPYGLGRELRDALGAGLMVNNDRILGNSARLLLASKEL